MENTAMQEMISKIINWLRPKSDCCKAPMKNIDVHITRLHTQMNIYECQSCKKEYIGL